MTFIRLAYNSWKHIIPRYVNLNKTTVILECGIGVGNLLGLLEEWFPSTHLSGLDINFEALIQAKAKIHNPSLIRASAEILPFPDKNFDLLISFHTIEHLPQPEQFLAEAFRVLRPHGILALATPNPQGIGARLMGRRWDGWEPGHISLHSPKQWQNLLKNHGFQILRDGTTGLSGLPIFRKLPLALLNWGPLFVFTFFPWNHGEAYICLAKKGD